MTSRSTGVPGDVRQRGGSGAGRVAEKRAGGAARRLHDNALGLVAALLFAVAMVAQAVAGRGAYNAEQRDHGQPEAGFTEYLATPHFAEATFENWESEFLQMGMYVLLTAFLVQRGSAESKKPEDEQDAGGEEIDEDPRLHRGDPDAPWPVRRGGWVLKLYENSLGIAFVLLFAASFLGHAASGAAEFSEEQAQHGGAAVSMLQYMGEPRFWFESFQNWQSEFLAVVSIVVLSIFLRQKGSPESKPVHRPHRETGAA
ncbi:MAG: DUF6766 family protein [Longimicrobiaceae bacterium]